MENEKENVNVMIVILGIILLTLIVGLFAYGFYDKAKYGFEVSDYGLDYYYVKEGDTLSTIAEKYCKEDDRINDWINAVMELNGMESSMLYAGHQLQVYTPKK